MDLKKRMKQLHISIRIKVDGETRQQYITLEEFENLDLSESEKIEVRQMLKENDILLLPKNRFSTHNSRISTNAYEYGKMQFLGLEASEPPKFATLEYDSIGNLIGEDYKNLDLFLEQEFIPRHIYYKSDAYGEEKVACIQLANLIILGLNELEVKHAFLYLDSQEVQIVGYNSSFVGEFPNYIYLHDYAVKMEKIPFDAEKFSILLEEYHRTKDKKLREQLIIMNKPLVDRVVQAYNSIICGVAAEELESYCWEALIKAVDNFDSTKEVKFSHYAQESMKNELYKKVPWQENFKRQRKFYFDCNDARNAVIIDNSFVENPYMEILKKLEESGVYPTDYQKTMLSVKYSENFDTLDETELVDNYTLEQRVFATFIAHDIDSVLEKLSESERELIRDYYGLNGSLKTLEECGAKQNISGEAVRQKRDRILKKVATPKNTRKLKDYLSIY